MNRAASDRYAGDRHAGRAEASAGVDAIESMLNANRAALDQTLSELEQRISMEGLFQEAVGRLRSDSGAEFLRSLRDSVVHNPLPVTLAAIGLAWTAVSERNSHASSATRLGDGQSKTAGAAHSLGAVKARGREWAERGGEAMDNARERAGELGQSAVGRTRQSVEQARDFALEYPIVMVGTGLILGAAVAALLPVTRVENEKLGPARDRIVDEARKTAEATVKGAKKGAQEESAGNGAGSGEVRKPQPGSTGSRPGTL